MSERVTAKLKYNLPKISGGDMEKLSKKLDGRNQWNTLETGANETRESILVAILTEYSDEACIHGDWKLVKG